MPAHSLRPIRALRPSTSAVPVKARSSYALDRALTFYCARNIIARECIFRREVPMPMTAAKNLTIAQAGGMLGGVMGDLGLGNNLAPDLGGEADAERKKREKALGDVATRVQSALGQNMQFGGAALDLGYR